MKILYVNTMGTWGGVATYLHILIKDQIRRGNQVYLLVGTKGELTTTIKKQLPSVKIILLPTLKRNIHIIDTLKAIYQFRQIVKKIKPDIIHLNCIMSGIVGRLGSIGLSPKIVYNAHGWAFEPGTNKKFKWPAIIIEKILSYLTNKIICVSNYEYKIANKYHIFKNKHQGIIIKNAAPDIKMKPSPKLKDNVFRITMAARFWRQKDQADLIRGFTILDNRLLSNKQMKLYLLGDGPTLKSCKQLSKQLHVNEDIVFTGEVNNVFDYYNKSDVVALITHYDAISISLIEALSMSKPIVASKVSGVPEDFNNNGYCINNNPNIIAKSFYKLFNNNELRIVMGYNSRRLFNEKFKISLNLKKHNNMYIYLLNGMSLY